MFAETYHKDKGNEFASSPLQVSKLSVKLLPPHDFSEECLSHHWRPAGSPAREMRAPCSTALLRPPHLFAGLPLISLAPEMKCDTLAGRQQGSEIKADSGDVIWA